MASLSMSIARASSRLRSAELDLATGKRTLWRSLAPADPAGVSQIGPIVMTPDGASYIYGYHRTLSDLYLVEGLK